MQGAHVMSWMREPQLSPEILQSLRELNHRFLDLVAVQARDWSSSGAHSPAAVSAQVASLSAAQKAAVAAAPATSAPAVDAPATAEKDKSINLAALPPGPSQPELTKSVQAELRRVGCLTGSADGEWNSSSQRSLTLFNRYAGTKLDAKLASVDTLDAIRQKSSRVCPLICEHGFKADGDRCSRISCAEGSFLNDDNECEKRRAKKPVARRDRPEARQAIARPSRPSLAPSSRPMAAGSPGTGQTGQPLTGTERAWGCNSNQAIMSGKCP